MMKIKNLVNRKDLDKYASLKGDHMLTNTDILTPIKPLNKKKRRNMS